jgi:hypothetical protein
MGSQPQREEAGLMPKAPFVSESTKRTRFAKTVRNDVRDKWRRTLGGVNGHPNALTERALDFFRAIGLQL